MRPVALPGRVRACSSSVCTAKESSTGFVFCLLHIGRARHARPKRPPTDMIVVECVNVGGWLSYGDLSLESQASFLSVVEHRLIPARARSVACGLRTESGVSSVWAPACQDSILGWHAGVRAVSLQDAPITLPSSYFFDLVELSV